MRRLSVVRSGSIPKTAEARRAAAVDGARIAPYVRAKLAKVIHFTSDVALTRFNGITATSVCGVWLGHSPELLEGVPDGAFVCEKCKRTTDG